MSRGAGGAACRYRGSRSAAKGLPMDRHYREPPNSSEVQGEPELILALLNGGVNRGL